MSMFNNYLLIGNFRVDQNCLLEYKDNDFKLLHKNNFKYQSLLSNLVTETKMHDVENYYEYRNNQWELIAQYKKDIIYYLYTISDDEVLAEKSDNTRYSELHELNLKTATSILVFNSTVQYVEYKLGFLLVRFSDSFPYKIYKRLGPGNYEAVSVLETFTEMSCCFDYEKSIDIICTIEKFESQGTYNTILRYTLSNSNDILG